MSKIVTVGEARAEALGVGGSDPVAQVLGALVVEARVGRMQSGLSANAEVLAGLTVALLQRSSVGGQLAAFAAPRAPAFTEADEKIGFKRNALQLQDGIDARTRSQYQRTIEGAFNLARTVLGASVRAAMENLRPDPVDERDPETIDEQQAAEEETVGLALEQDPSLSEEDYDG